MNQASNPATQPSEIIEAPQEQAEPVPALTPLLDALVAQPVNGSVPKHPASLSRRKRKLARGCQSVSPGQVVIGTFTGSNGQAELLVTHPLNPSDTALPARSTIPLTLTQVGQKVVLAFEQGDVRRPIVLGVLWQPDNIEPASKPVDLAERQRRPGVHVTADGEQVVIAAEKELVMQCGKASITLTPAGKIVLRGTYLLSRSSGVNRIQGGSIELN